MKLFNTEFITFLSLSLLLTACDPADIDPDAIGSASSGGSSLGLFQLVSEDYNEGALTSGDISVSKGDKDGSGTFNNPLVFGLGNTYSFTLASTVSTESTVEFSLYSPENPETETSFAEIPCSSTTTANCGDTQEMRCWFVGAQSGVSYDTTFFCKYEDDFVETISSQEEMVNHFLPDWSGEWSDLDLTLGVKVSLCDASNDTSCDVANLGYFRLKEYKE